MSGGTWENNFRRLSFSGEDQVSKLAILACKLEQTKVKGKLTGLCQLVLCFGSFVNKANRPMPPVRRTDLTKLWLSGLILRARANLPRSI